MAGAKKVQSRKRLTLFPYKQARSALVDGIENALILTRQHSKFSRYSLALLSSAFFILIKLSLQPLIGDDTPFLLVLPAVLISAWFGGIGPGLVSGVLTGLMIWYFFFPPEYSFVISDAKRLFIDLSIYAVEALGVIFIVHRRNKAYELMQERTAQQAIVATIGQYGLEESDITSLIEKIVRAVCKALHVEYSRILEVVPESTELHYRSGSGWGSDARKALVPMQSTPAGYALSLKKPVIISDLHKKRRYSADPLFEKHQIVSGMSIPINVGDSPFGVLEVYTTEKRKFTQNDTVFMRAMANVLSTTIERKNSQQTLRLMAAISSALVSYLDPKKALSALVRVVVPQFADTCEVYMKGSDNKIVQVESYASDKYKREVLIEQAKKYPPKKGSQRFSAQALHTGKALFFPFVDDTLIENSTDNSEHFKLQRKLKTKSTIIVPLKIRQRIIGVMTFGTSEKGNIYTKHDFVIAKEIADRAALALENSQLYQEAKDAVQARDEFLSIASHELKTPLTSMLLQLQSVLHSMKSQSLASFSIEKTMTMLESTVGQSKRLSTLINDLLNISLITTGRLTLQKERSNLVGVTTDVISRLKGQADAAGVKITYEGEKKVIGEFDKVRIEQVITNLLTNAIKYGDSKPVRVQLKAAKGKAYLSVIDRGIGISEDQQSVIFNRFVRAGGIKKSYKGLGVGLYLANQIVASHGGGITVESKPKKGSTFTVTLPLTSRKGS